MCLVVLWRRAVTAEEAGVCSRVAHVRYVVVFAHSLLSGKGDEVQPFLKFRAQRVCF